MKTILTLIVCLILSSCASRYDMIDIERRIQLTEDRQWEDIQNDVKVLIEKHPELSSSQKEDVAKAFLEGFERHRILKIQERAAINLLLHATLDPKESEGVRTGLQKQLSEIYVRKVTNIETVINSVSVPLRALAQEEKLEKDIRTLMREFP